MLYREASAFSKGVFDMKLGELAARLGCTLEGDAGVEIIGAQGLESAKPGELSFL